ncbi:hypothetical protein [Vibrio superstes]|uniref:Uncharacterized protein n=1 Tax=Vibrio superstes NBRC 103154 TaxID=1219062 RepID=A0A511QNW4_9VIBR|nr:hypothetical protein [Vibrio superstes]GEM79025.1 hypothetical protein VSU01S_12700 [Vibrio superstes NBRC 103154]
MKYLYKITFICLFLAFNSMASEVDELIPQAKVDHFIELAFSQKSSTYTEYAVLFNFCQQRAEHADCKKPFEEAESRYKVAEANHKVLLMVANTDMKSLEMPVAGEQELTSLLAEQDYVDEEVAHTSALVNALNLWLEDNQMPQTDKVYFLHSLMVKVDSAHQKQAQ